MRVAHIVVTFRNSTGWTCFSANEYDGVCLRHLQYSKYGLVTACGRPARAPNRSGERVEGYAPRPGGSNRGCARLRDGFYGFLLHHLSARLISVQRAGVAAAARLELDDIRIYAGSRDWQALNAVRGNRLAGLQPDAAACAHVPSFQTAHKFPSQLQIPVVKPVPAATLTRMPAPPGRAVRRPYWFTVSHGHASAKVYLSDTENRLGGRGRNGYS